MTFWTEILTALALVLVLEGILPFMNPSAYRRMILMVAKMNDSSLRAAGLTFMLSGVLLLYLVH